MLRVLAATLIITGMGVLLFFTIGEAAIVITPVLGLSVWLTAAFSHQRDRRIPPGHCQHCGYSLTGNTSGVCPECGTAVTSPSEPPAS